MRFGMFVPQGWRLDLVEIAPGQQWPAIRDLALRAEANPDWESVWVYDHFHTVPVATDEATHEAWTLMAALAASTARIRLGQMCTAMSYRNPAYLAKVAATVDLVSSGRLEMGIGAGWYEQEWRAYGYEFPRAGVRLARLDEGVQILRQAWTTGRAILDGEHYQVDNAIVRPLPAQLGGPPLWIAGGGEKVTLRLAAKYAQYTNFDGSPAGFAHKSGILAGHCAEVGTDFDSIVRSANYNVVLGVDAGDVEARLTTVANRLARFVSPDEVERAMSGLRGPGIGTPEQVTANLLELRDLGLGYAICYFPELPYDVSGVELFEREVIPALRSAGP